MIECIVSAKVRNSIFFITHHQFQAPDLIPGHKIHFLQFHPLHNSICSRFPTPTQPFELQLATTIVAAPAAAYSTKRQRVHRAWRAICLGLTLNCFFFNFSCFTFYGILNWSLNFIFLLWKYTFDFPSSLFGLSSWGLKGVVVGASFPDALGDSRLVVFPLVFFGSPALSRYANAKSTKIVHTQHKYRYH